MNRSSLFGQCNGLVDAGPDIFTCDPTMMLQLQGVINGNPNKFEWTPANGLSDPKSIDPMVTLKTPGKYKYKLSAEVIGNNNLIVNGNFEGGYSGFSTEYVFKILGQGFGPDNVAIATNPQLYNSGFSTCGDHTSGSSNMWLVDGSTQAGKKVWCQTVAVTPGNMYQFELYSMSVFATAPAILGITVNGNNIGGGQVGGLCDWALMMACFTATSGSATICISEQTGVGYGNDFALDDIALYDKCIDEDEVEVEIVDLKAAIQIPVKPKCSSEIFDLFGTGSSAGPGISYEWSSIGGTIVSTNGLIAKGKGTGTYIIKVVYRNGNTVCEEEATIDYEAPEKLDGLIREQGIANCSKDTISLQVNMNTGSGIYTYDWSPQADIISGDSTETIKVLKPQNYKVTITDISTGCKLELDKSVSADTTIPDFKLSGDTLINCVRRNINLLASVNDTNTFEYEWTFPNKLIEKNRSEIQSNQTGIYQLKLINKKNNCSNVQFWNVFIDTLQPQINTDSVIEINCINNNASIKLNGIHTLNQKYYWTFPDGSFVSDDTIELKTLNQSGYVTVRTLNQINGCYDLDSIVIRDIRKFPSLNFLPALELNCMRDKIQLTATSNNYNNLIIQWSSNNGNIIGSPDSFDISADQKGIYKVRLVDTTNHCEVVDSIAVFENFIKPTVTLGPNLIFQCKDTVLSIDASQSSSGPSYQYHWTTSNGNILSGNGTNNISITTSGNYTLVIKDTLNGCQDSATIIVVPDANKPTLNINPPNELNCRTNSIILEAIGNTQTGNSLTYSWTSNNNQKITNPNQSKPTVIEAGTYTVIVTDNGNGCSSSSSVIVLIDTIKPVADAGSDLILNCGIQVVSLRGESNSNTSGLSFQWTTSNGIIINGPDPIKITTNSPGTYEFNVLNLKNGCENSDQLIVNIDTVKPIVNILLPDTLSCNISTITLYSTGSANSGSSYYNWLTQSGNILDSLNLKQIKINKPGRYSLTIIDSSNLCSATRSIDVIEDKSLPVILIQKPGELSCTIKQLSLNANLLNVTNPFIIWSSPSGNILSGQNSVNPLISGQAYYFIKVTGRNGCSVTDSVFVKENTNIPLSINPEYSQPKCQGDIAYLNSVIVQGGEKPLQYLLDGIGISQFPVSNLSPGMHNLKVIDKNGCELNSSFQVNLPSLIDVSLPQDLKIDEGTNATLKFTTSLNSDSIESIEWQPAEKLTCNTCPNPETRNLEEDNTFTITLTNKNGCTATATIRILLIKRGIWMPNIFSPNGDGINDFLQPIGIPESIKSIKSFQIYDRWGALLFKKENINPFENVFGWNGDFKDQPSSTGVYTYWLSIEWNNGETQILKGDCTLIR
ncbi:MAG: gliding motility-associated C-terminal domain-containing protein [Saprospiraceae bacterium]|nr:gliding motility-associated C-terminal domain-containing protein [Saprospiraceae bacterium]